MRSIGLVLSVGFAVVLLVYGGWLPVSEVGAEEQATTEEAGEWPMYRRDLAATGFSPLDQITTTNVTGLIQAWTYSLEAATEGAHGDLRADIERSAHTRELPEVWRGWAWQGGGGDTCTGRPEE